MKRFATLFILLAVIFDSGIAVSDVTIPSGTKKSLSNEDYNRFDIFRVHNFYFADDSAHTMRVAAPGTLANDDYSFVFPGSDGTNHQCLATDGAEGLSWESVIRPGIGQIVDADVSPSAAIGYGKLNLTGGIVNADVSSSAAITYSKLNLSGGVVNADVANSAAIAYSKLNLAGSIVDSDISSSAAIAYSKLNLTGSLTTGDLASGFTLPIANGGTGQTTAPNAINALLPDQTSNNGKFLTTDGSVASWGTPASSLQSAYDGGATITTAASPGYIVINGDQGLDVETTGGSDFINPGTSGALFLQTSNPLNSSDTLDIEQDGTGAAISAVVNNGANTSQALFLQNNGAGEALLLSGTSTANRLKISGSTLGYIGINVPATITSYSLILPNAQGSEYLKDDGAGNLSWSNAVNALGAVGSSPNADGASISGDTLTLQPADSTNPGVISTSAQTIPGAKTFGGDITVNTNLTYTVTNDSSTTGSNANLAHPTTYIRLSNASLTSIACIANASNGHFLAIINATGNAFTVVDNYGSCSGSYAPIRTGYAKNISLPNNGGMQLIYSPTNGYWRLLGSTTTTLASAVDLTSDVTGVLPVANGGTGLTSLSTFAFLTSTQTLTNTSLQDQGTHIVDFSDATKKINFDAAGTAGTATTIQGSQTVDRTLTLPDATDTLVGKATTDTLTNKTISGSSNTITNVSLTSGVTGTLPIASGGTGQITANDALNALLPSQTGNSGKVLSTNATDASWVSVFSNPMTTLGDLVYENASPAPARLAGNTTTTTKFLTQTGDGVNSAAPSWAQVGLTTGVTGTLPIANGGTGITSFGSGVATWLGTPSSANLASALTDETGSGKAVFDTSPTIQTPTITAASDSVQAIVKGNGTQTSNIFNVTKSDDTVLLGVTNTAGTAIKGTTTGSVAGSGIVGQVIVKRGTTNCSSGAYFDVANIASGDGFGAGVWEFTADLSFAKNSATMSAADLEWGITKNSGNSSANATVGDNFFETISVGLTSSITLYYGHIGPVLVTSDGTNTVIGGQGSAAFTTLYLKGYCGSFTGGPASVGYTYSAKRIY